MKLCKYYSLDECKNKESVLIKLDDLQNDSKVEFTYFDDDDVIKIKSIGLTLKEKKDMISYFRDNDIIDYPDYEEYYEDDFEDEEESEDEDYEY